MMIVGIGQDSHRFCKGKKLVLGGLVIDGADGLLGNSDGDVVLHALCNAILSAMGRGSLSTYSDEMCRKGISDSTEYLRKALSSLGGARINNISIAIEGATPRLEAHLPDMKRKIGAICGLDEKRVGITVTSGEGLTAFGRGEGLQVIAMVSIDG